MRRYFLACSMAAVFALVAGAAAQSPPATSQPQPQTRTPTAQDQTMATVEGCLMRQQDVPGHKSNLAEKTAEKTGMMEDYVLTNAKVVKGTAPSAAMPQARSGEPTGTSGTLSEPMFDVKGIDDARLKPYIGKRVQIDGTFADLDRSATAKPTEDLVDIKGVTIRQASGECPAK